MNLVELSDLEEGEILEYESVSPYDSRSNHCGVRLFDSPIQPNKKDQKENGKHGQVRQNSNIVTIDLESISSDGEVNSDNEKYPPEESRNYDCKNGRRIIKKRGTYGTVEDIMSEIGETISRCCHKRRKSRDFDKHSDASYDAWRRKMFSSNVKVKKRKRKLSFSNSDSEVEKSRAERRRKRKRKRENGHEEETKPKVLDFDEVRKGLLEKLKKQKAEEESKAKMLEESKEENSEIQMVDMLVDCTNYVDKVEEEKEGEDELDLIQLRLIALTSNKKQKDTVEKTEEKPSETNKEDPELDRNELLLRAEALKTALLKKHEKILSRLKGKKQSEVGSSGDDVLPPKKEALDSCPWKENVEKNEGVTAAGNSAPSELDEKVSTPATNTKKKPLTKARGKRKKRKSVSFANNLKENTEKNETLEEDDRTLRSQLLKDLMKKKSLKDLEKKSVLMDAIQTSANKSSVIEPPKEIAKPLPVVKKTSVKKVNAVKPVVAPNIPKPEIQRIIVHLGSEDSSDAEDADQSLRLTKDKKNKPTENNVQADYERSVELLLSEARRKIEGEKQKAAKSFLATPEAVYKHLPPSQRLEYIRLKQKIAERERLKIQKSENASVSAPQSADTPKPSTPVNSLPTQTRPKTNQGLAINSVKNGPSTLRGSKPPSLLLPSSQALISKLKLLLKKIKIEKTIEENYDREMTKLKAQLSLLEKKKTEQRFKIRKLGEESMKTYKAIQVITARSLEEKKKDGPGEDVIKPKEEKKPETEGKIITNERATEITKAETKAGTEVKDVPVAPEAPSVVSTLEYHSPIVTSGQVSDKVDPNVMLCQFDLTGVCKDEECGYQHLRAS